MEIGATLPSFSPQARYLFKSVRWDVGFAKMWISEEASENFRMVLKQIVVGL